MVIAHGWDPLTLFRTAIEMGTVKVSVKDTKPRIGGGEIATMVMPTDIELSSSFRSTLSRRESCLLLVASLTQNPRGARSHPREAPVLQGAMGEGSIPCRTGVGQRSRDHTLGRRCLLTLNVFVRVS